jgi:ankyrin repeat protein
MSKSFNLAIMNNNFSEFQELLKKSNARPGDLLRSAVYYQRPEMVRLLLQDPMVDPNLGAVLTMAVSHNMVNMVEMLLSHPQIDLTTLDEDEETVLDLIEANEADLDPKIVKMVRDKQNNKMK